MSNDSSTGGPLSPAASPAPLEGQALNRFIQSWVVGIVGLPGPMVVPRWQTEPPTLPNAGTAWAAIGVLDRPSDAFPQVIHQDDADTLARNETLDVLASFYDLGADGDADYYAALLRDGAIISQNQEVLRTNGFALTEVGSLKTVPSLLKNRWQYRVDLPITLRRMILRVYPVLDLESATAEIVVNDEADGTIDITLNVQE